MTETLCVFAGALLGAVVAWLVVRARLLLERERSATAGAELAKVQAHLADSEEELKHARDALPRAEEKARRTDELERQCADLRVGKEELAVRIAELGKSRETDQEKLQWLEQAKKLMADTFQALASTALNTNNDEFLKQAREQVDKLLGTVQGDWKVQKEQIGKLVEPLGKTLETLDKQVRELEQKREGAYKGIEQHLKQLSESSLLLQTSTVKLEQALRNTSTRGRWGEVQLRLVVELAGMQDHVDFHEQAQGEEGRPDMVIHLPKGVVLPVDSKVPMNAYLDAMAASDEPTRKKLLQDHAKAFRDHVRKLSGKKYWEQFERAPDFVVLFVPNEACLGAAFQADPTLFEAAIREHVVVASPFTLFALLKAFEYGWQQHQFAENAQVIMERGNELYHRICTFLGDLQDTGSGLRKAVEAYNKAIGSLENRLLPAARDFKGLARIQKELPAPDPVQIETRVPLVIEGPDGLGEARRKDK